MEVKVLGRYVSVLGESLSIRSQQWARNWLEGRRELLRKTKPVIRQQQSVKITDSDS